MAQTERAYLSLAEFKARSIMPPGDVDALETLYTGFWLARLKANSGGLNARLAKRYAVPFGDPVPEIVLDWLTSITTLDGYMRRGFNPASEQDALVRDAADRARAELKEAADSNTGLYDLPLLATAADGSGISKGGPFGYSEQSPFVAFDVQRSTARDEDSRGYGS